MNDSSRPLAVVTGASSGIGEQFAHRYAREGHDLVLVARSGTALRALADEISARYSVDAVAHVADLTKPTDVATLVTALESGLPRLDHLVNSAGVAPEGDLTDTDEAALRQAIDLNVTALTLLTQAAIIRMRAQGTGTIINIGSAAGYQPMPHFAAYSATKSYVINLTEALSEENRRFGLRIFAVSPGDTDTGMGSNPSTNKRRPEQVVDTAWRAMAGAAPSVVDGTANTILAMLSSRVFPKRFGLRTAERMMRRMI
ncbi:oxidoreductase [Curtobacterium sp. MCPF17_018]|uniref:SDR family NAD(P)-dependent oxidoreductase n=1 Tax=Curtobacterium sp. MCPF17_018 TaxID=2175638 RepID=UPI000DA74AEC|nr:SDR family NAD(P)-dependent oxidoreductase [Curtobacterium sp. MCPF17_018]PZE69279.1 oxidoreductase [Curtobacterium sp. MCPF17_018]